MLTHHDEQRPFETKDGSQIRELMHPAIHGNSAQSLAEAQIQPGQRTRPHRHLSSEELYHVIRGRGTMTLGDQSFAIRPGDTVAIPPSTPHCVACDGDEPLIILCCCSPPYAHSDTQLL